MCQSGKFISYQVHHGPVIFRVIFNTRARAWGHDKKNCDHPCGPCNGLDLFISHIGFINNFSFILNANRVCCINLHSLFKFVGVRISVQHLLSLLVFKLLFSPTLL